MVDSRKLRDAFGQFATGVAIVTMRTDDAVPYGVTINSFASVSLKPPLLSWCLDKSSDMAELFAEATYFCVNVLAADSQELADLMAQSGTHKLPKDSFCISESGAVLMQGALAHFECTVYNRIEAGDHVIYLGAVADVGFCPESRAPLLYFRGGYLAV